MTTTTTTTNTRDFFAFAFQTFVSSRDNNDTQETAFQETLVHSLPDYLATFGTPAFARFAVWYIGLYLALVVGFALIGTVVFGVDYRAHLTPTQLRREVRLSAEGLVSYMIMAHSALQLVPTWDTDTSRPGAMLLELFLHLNLFNFFFYASHKLWHSNRTLYKWVHADHHESVVVNPLTSLSNSCWESIWLGSGTLIAPCLLGWNNLWAWYGSIALVLLLAVQGHSRIPFTLEHAAHHANLTKNLAFYFPVPGVLLPYDAWFGTWTFASVVKKCCKLYPRELSLYQWDTTASPQLNWDALFVVVSDGKNQEPLEQKAQVVADATNHPKPAAEQLLSTIPEEEEEESTSMMKSKVVVLAISSDDNDDDLLTSTSTSSESATSVSSSSEEEEEDDSSLWNKKKNDNDETTRRPQRAFGIRRRLWKNRWSHYGRGKSSRNTTTTQGTVVVSTTEKNP